MWSSGKKWPLNKTWDKAQCQALELLFTVVTKDLSTTSTVSSDLDVTFMSRVQYLRPYTMVLCPVIPALGGMG